MQSRLCVVFVLFFFINPSKLLLTERRNRVDLFLSQGRLLRCQWWVSVWFPGDMCFTVAALRIEIHKWLCWRTWHVIQAWQLYDRPANSSQYSIKKKESVVVLCNPFLWKLYDGTQMCGGLKIKTKCPYRLNRLPLLCRREIFNFLKLCETVERNLILLSTSTNAGETFFKRKKIGFNMTVTPRKPKDTRQRKR